MTELETLAMQMRQAFAAGVPVRMPLLRFRDLDILLALLADD